MFFWGEEDRNQIIVNILTKFKGGIFVDTDIKNSNLEQKTQGDCRQSNLLAYSLIALVCSLIVSGVANVSSKCIDKSDSFEDEKTKQIFILSFATTVVSVVAGTAAVVKTFIKDIKF